MSAPPTPLRTLAWRLASVPVALALFVYLRAVVRAARCDDDGPPLRPAVFALWHRDLPFLIVRLGARRPWVLMSPAPNLLPIHRLMRWLGHRGVIGTSGAGGRRALEELVRRRDPLDDMWLAVDGPAGPGFRAKPGVVWLARATGVPIVPIGYRATSDRPLRGRWDRMRFHSPGDRFTVVYGEPIHVGDDDEDDDVIPRVERALHALSERTGQSPP